MPIRTSGIEVRVRLGPNFTFAVTTAHLACKHTHATLLALVSLTYRIECVGVISLALDQGHSLRIRSLYSTIQGAQHTMRKTDAVPKLVAYTTGSTRTTVT